MKITFKNDVTVTVFDEAEDPRNWGEVSEDDVTLYVASASHDKTGPIQVTSFEKRYVEVDTPFGLNDNEEAVFGLEPDELLKFMNKAASMRFTEDGEQCVAFFDF